tara:strand:+ start:148 stop:1851 length:1704 start_codon:yes stop_codon:yes gene_type:complete
MNSFFKIYNNLKKNEKNKFFLIFIFMFFLIILELFSLALFLPLISLIISDNKIPLLGDISFINNLDRFDQIIFFLILIISAFVLKNLFYGYLIYFRKKFLSDIQVDFTSRIFKSYLSQSYSFYLKKDKSEIMRNLGIVSEYIIVLENFVSLMLESLILIGIFLIILIKDAQVGLFILFFSLFFLYFSTSILKNKFRKYGIIVNEYEEKLIKVYLDTLGSIKDILLQKKQDYFLNQFSKNISKQAYTNVKNSFLLEMPRLFIEIFIVVTISLLVYFLISKNLDSESILITLTFIVTLIFRAIPAISRIVFQLNSLSFKIDIMNKVNHLISKLKSGDTLISKYDEIDFKNFDLKNVSFKYGDTHSNFIFKNLNLEIKKKDVIGIIGASGSGKSTLIDIISGMLKPEIGEIKINDRLVDPDMIASWQSKIAYISQKNYLMNASILENIAFGEPKEKIDNKKLKEAINYSKINKLIEDKTEGLDFLIGEDGKKVSGGQRQRIILARAIYRNAEIIIFDEATSSLDTRVEKEIFDDLRDNFKSKKTLIISTHKHELLSFCDKIINIDTINSK